MVWIFVIGVPAKAVFFLFLSLSFLPIPSNECLLYVYVWMVLYIKVCTVQLDGTKYLLIHCVHTLPVCTKCNGRAKAL